MGILDPRNVILGTDGTIHLIDWCCSVTGPVPQSDLYNILREHDAEGEQVEAFLEGHGMSRDEFWEILDSVRGYGLVEMIRDVLWALRERPDVVPEQMEKLGNYWEKYPLHSRN